MRKITQKELDKLIESHQEYLKSGEEKYRLKLNDTDCSGLDLRNANLRSSNLIGANLSYANLSYADLSYANLSYADLRYADLRYADLRSADLRGADLRSANLSDADLRGADLRGAKTDLQIISIIGIGSERRMTTYIFDFDKIFCGCFSGTLAEFEARVKEKKANNKKELSEYLDFIEYLKKRKSDV
jgi:hypothetical protein